MILKRGDMFQDGGNPKVVLVATGNAVVNRDRVVMGKGAALSMKEHFPGIDKKFGELVNNGVFYGYVEVPYMDRRLGLFQTKQHYRDDSTIDLIKRSTELFIEHLNLYFKGTEYIHRLNFPGIGLGNLAIKRDEILSIVSLLPASVEVWEF